MTYQFDANEYIAGLDAPTFTVGDRTWTGRFLGVEDWFRVVDRIEQLDNGELPVTEMRALIRDLTAAIFPDPEPTGRLRWWDRWWNRRKRSAESAVVAMGTLPFTAQLAALRTFIDSQVTALRGPGRIQPPDLATIQAAMPAPKVEPPANTSSG